MKTDPAKASLNYREIANEGIFIGSIESWSFRDVVLRIAKGEGRDGSREFVLLERVRLKNSCWLLGKFDFAGEKVNRLARTKSDQRASENHLPLESNETESIRSYLNWKSPEAMPSLLI